MKHPTKINNYKGSLEDLAKEIVNLRYDAVIYFLNCLQKEFIKEAENDHSKGRKKLAFELQFVAGSLSRSCYYLEKAWNICKPFIKE